MNHRIALVGVIALSLTLAARAEVTLKVGDPAPKLQVDKWLKGQPVKELQKGRVYVIECWATWCGPCVASMPHVTRLQAKYRDKGVVILGINVWEKDRSAPEPFVKKMDAKMGYAVATDDVKPGQPGAMATTWLKAAGRNGIPCSFLVDRQGNIAWIGRPMMMERPLAMLADDKFDPAEQAKFTEQMDAASAEFGAATKAKEYDKALAALAQLATLNPYMSPQYAATRLSLLLKKGDYAAANAQAVAIAQDKSRDDDSLLATVAATLLNAPDVDKVDVALALKLATQAYEANAREGWQYQALLARAYAANKQFDKAADLQAQVVRQVPGQMKEREQQTLDEYKQKSAPPK